MQGSAARGQPLWDGRGISNRRLEPPPGLGQPGGALYHPGRAREADPRRRAHLAPAADLDDDALEAMLFAQPPRPGTRPVPDWAKVHLELRRKGVTLTLVWHEYKQTFPDGYVYSQFNELYGTGSSTSTSSCARSTKPAKSSSSTSQAKQSLFTTGARARLPCKQNYLSPPSVLVAFFTARCSLPRNCVGWHS